jgi:hypothetical protein
MLRVSVPWVGLQRARVYNVLLVAQFPNASCSLLTGDSLQEMRGLGPQPHPQHA